MVYRYSMRKIRTRTEEETKEGTLFRVVKAEGPIRFLYHLELEEVEN